MDENKTCPNDPQQSAAAQGRYAAEWGLASLLTGGVAVLADCIMLHFSVHMVHIGMYDRWNRTDVTLAVVATLLAAPALLLLGLAGLVLGVRGTRRAFAHCLPAGLPIGGIVVSLVAVLLWLVAFGAQTGALLALSQRT